MQNRIARSSDYGGTMHKGYADIPSGQIHYRDMGQGEPLLLLHEAMRTSAAYTHLVPLFAPSVRAIAMDTPGYGESFLPTGPPMIEGYARFVAEFLDALGIRKASLFGRHTGASIAAEFATLYPDRVTKLIFDGLPDFEPEDRAKRLAAAPLLPLQPDGSHIHRAFQGAWEYRRDAVSPELKQAALIDWIHAAGMPDWGHVAVYTQDVRTRIPMIKAPVLLMSGVDDPMFEPQRKLIPLFHDVRPVVLGSRFPTEEHSEEAVRIVVEFLREKQKS